VAARLLFSILGTFYFSPFKIIEKQKRPQISLCGQPSNDEDQKAKSKIKSMIGTSNKTACSQFFAYEIDFIYSFPVLPLLTKE